MTLAPAQAMITSSLVIDTLSTDETKSFQYICDVDDDAPSTRNDKGTWVLYQWHMIQPADSTGPGFELQAPHFVCSQPFEEAPRCPLGFCADDYCQVCTAPFEVFGIGSSADDPFIITTPVNVDTDSPFTSASTRAPLLHGDSSVVSSTPAGGGSTTISVPRPITNSTKSGTCSVTTRHWWTVMGVVVSLFSWLCWG